MKTISLKFKKIMAKILEVIAIILISIGIITLLPWMYMASFAIFTHINQGYVQMSDNIRLFYLEWMIFGSLPVTIGGVTLIYAQNILKRIKWRMEEQESL